MDAPTPSAMPPARPLSPSPPLVRGQRTAVEQVDHADLPQYAHIDALVALVNAAFAATHGPPYFPTDVVRVKDREEMIADLAPPSIAYVLTQAGEEDRVDIVGAVMEELAGGDEDQRGQLQGVAGEVRSDVRFLVVNPAYHRQGIGAWLMRYLEAKIKQRAWLESASQGKPLPIIRVVLKTAEEVNGPFYEHLGWRAFEKVSKPVGTFGSPLGFTMVSMEKILELDVDESTKG